MSLRGHFLDLFSSLSIQFLDNLNQSLIAFIIVFIVMTPKFISYLNLSELQTYIPYCLHHVFV